MGGNTKGVNFFVSSNRGKFKNHITSIKYKTAKFGSGN